MIIWHMLILRDHWQGEFAVAFFGALGWALIALLSPPDLLKVERLKLLNDIMGEHAWAMFFVVFASVQLYGLKHSHAWQRLIGATGILIGFVCVFLSEFLAEPWTLALAAYAACICIEVCSTIYQTAHIVRYQEYPVWLATLLKN